MSWKLFFQIIILILIAGIVMANTWYLKITPLKCFQAGCLKKKAIFCTHRGHYHPFYKAYGTDYICDTTK